MTIWINYLISHPTTQCCAVLFLFVVKESIRESLEKIGPFLFVQMDILVKVGVEGALHLTCSCSVNWQF